MGLWRIVEMFVTPLNLIGAAGSAFVGVWGYLEGSITFKSLLINFYLMFASPFVVFISIESWCWCWCLMELLLLLHRLFSIFIVLAELRIKPFLVNFRFLASIFGKSMTILL